MVIYPRKRSVKLISSSLLHGVETRTTKPHAVTKATGVCFRMRGFH